MTQLRRSRKRGVTRKEKKVTPDLERVGQLWAILALSSQSQSRIAHTV
jgi:hypothetical protein